MDKEQYFKEKLEKVHVFPGIYTFKFIVKPSQRGLVEALVKKADISVKSSANHNYVSVTIKAEMQKSEEVIEIYKKAKKIEGILSL